MPQRIQRKRTKGWRMPEGAVYVGRPSRWGNPFRIYGEHTTMGPPWSVARETWRHIPASECATWYVTSSSLLGPDDAVALYCDLLAVRRRDEPGLFATWLAPLADRDLACWCPPGHACHADALLRFANGGAA